MSKAVMKKVRFESPNRTRRIGGSEAAAVLGLHPHMTPVELWLKKMGRFQVPQNEAMIWGSLLEPVILQEYAFRTGVELLDAPEIAPDDKPWAIAHLDGLARDPKTGEEWVVEIKTTRFFDRSQGWGEPGTDVVPVHYYLQVQHYMHLGGWKKAVIAALGGTSEFRVYEIPYQADISHALMEAEREFWEKYIVPEKIPPRTRPSDVDLIYATPNGEGVEATPEIIRLIQEARDIQSKIKELEAKKKEIEGQIKEFMADAEILTSPDGEVLATWRISRFERIDTKRLKAELPRDLWEPFITTRETRVFRLK